MSSKPTYFPNLDGLRFFSFFSVFLFHCFYTEIPEILKSKLYQFVTKIFSNGFIGVNFFFVLSGFLISYLLFLEQKKTDRINVGHFYVRRILKIWPLYILLILIGFIAWPILKQASGENFKEVANWKNYVLFINNFETAIYGIKPSAAVLGILWSISIEEQFYLVWPHLVKFFKSKLFIALCLGIIIISMCYRAFHLDNYNQLYYHTLSVISDMAMGGMIAYFAFFSDRFRNTIENLPKYFIALLYLITIVLILNKKELFGYINEPQIIFERLILSILFGLIILEQNYSKNSLFKLCKLKLFSTLGKYTYGLYMYQFIGIILALKISSFIGTNKSIWGVLLFETLLGLIITIIISISSYHVFEKRILKIKNKFTHI
jgi:peptidoglycan/LPS O-acetylase OafA/YrhL